MRVSVFSKNDQLNSLDMWFISSCENMFCFVFLHIALVPVKLRADCLGKFILLSPATRVSVNGGFRAGLRPGISRMMAASEATQLLAFESEFWWENKSLPRYLIITIMFENTGAHVCLNVTHEPLAWCVSADHNSPRRPFSHSACLHGAKCTLKRTHFNSCRIDLPAPRTKVSATGHKTVGARRFVWKSGPSYLRACLSECTSRGIWGWFIVCLCIPKPLLHTASNGLLKWSSYPAGKMLSCPSVGHCWWVGKW